MCLCVLKNLLRDHMLRLGNGYSINVANTSVLITAIIQDHRSHCGVNASKPIALAATAY